MTNQHLPISPETPAPAVDRSLGEIRVALSVLKHEVMTLANRVIELERRHMTGTIQGLPGRWTVSPPPEWEQDGCQCVQDVKKSLTSEED